MADHVQQWVCPRCEEWYDERDVAIACCMPEAYEVGVLDGNDDWDFTVYRCSCCDDLYGSVEAQREHVAARDEPWEAWYCRDCNVGGTDYETRHGLMADCECEDKAELEIQLAADDAPGGVMDSERKHAVAMSAPTDSYDGDYWK